MPTLITSKRAWALYTIVQTRALERMAAAALPEHTLMARAGLAAAHLALALAPHARCIWIACGPGNNGGDGIEAAVHLKRWGCHPVVTWLGDEAEMPRDAHIALQHARAAQVPFADAPPAELQPTDLCMDALLGVGANRAPSGRMAHWLALMRESAAPLLSLDTPSGLNTDTGAWCGAPRPRPLSTAAGVPASRHTLSLLTLKPGLFTADGRDACGTVWFDDLGIGQDSTAESAPASNPAQRLPVLPQAHQTTVQENGDESDTEAPLQPALRQPDQLPDTAAIRPMASAWLTAKPIALPRPAASHKGWFGDIAVIGGEDDPAHGSAMVGAALLAATAALHAGAGRVYVAPLDAGQMRFSTAQPELMFRRPETLPLEQLTVVCGCGGGTAVARVLPDILARAAKLVLDADALNAIAAHAPLRRQLSARAQRGQPTVLTPHPLEAARLLGTSTANVQADRLRAAQTLADEFHCVVVLKGSGTVIAAPGQTPHINPSGNARLATPGSGDVLAGLTGARLGACQASSSNDEKTPRQTQFLPDSVSAIAAFGPLPTAISEAVFTATCRAVFEHGAIADRWPPSTTLTASALARSLTP